MQLYEVLGVSPHATHEEIRAAVTQQRRLWRRRATSPDINVRHEAERRMHLIDQAERALVDGGENPLQSDAATDPSAEVDTRWVVRATEQLERGQHGAALFSAQRAIAADPDNAYAYCMLAEAAMATGDEWSATDAIDRALYLEPEDARLHLQRALIYQATGDIARATAALQTAISLDATEPDYHIHLVRLYADRGDLEAAIAAGEKAYQAHPEDGEIRSLLAEVLAERAVEAHHELADGRLLITSSEQADYVAALCERGLSVHPPHSTIETDLRSSLRYARRAKKRAFSPAHFRQHWKWPVGVGFLTLAGVCCVSNVASPDVDASVRGLTVLVGVVLVAAFLLVTWMTSFEVRYKLNASILERVVPKRMGRVGASDAGTAPPATVRPRLPLRATRLAPTSSDDPNGGRNQ